VRSAFFLGLLFGGVFCGSVVAVVAVVLDSWPRPGAGAAGASAAAAVEQLGADEPLAGVVRVEEMPAAPRRHALDEDTGEVRLLRKSYDRPARTSRAVERSPRSRARGLA